MQYKVKLEIFEGPLDLLLYLIKKEELDIYDIPIAKITDQYLEYIEMMKLLDLDIAGEFIVMAATLMHIKSKMLLPPEEVPQEDIEEEDPRAELVKRLLEYKKFKEAADELAKRESESSKIYARRPSEPSVIKDDDSPFFEASIFDLLTAFSKVLKEIPKETFYKVVKEEFSVGDKIHDIFHMLVDNQRIYFSSLLRKARNKLEVVVIFLAVLELIRLKEIVIVQASPFSEIEIIRNSETLKPTNL